MPNPSPMHTKLVFSDIRTFKRLLVLPSGGLAIISILFWKDRANLSDALRKAVFELLVVEPFSLVVLSHRALFVGRLVSHRRIERSLEHFSHRIFDVCV